MRREIARAMHDGPAQSLTNIVLQAQIVERLVANDPEQASGEVGQLVAMVQQTLDATKSFIFDVRPMVLDDLGLVPTLRRAARDRGRRAGVPVEFESMGQDRRLPMDLESGLFRILDEALAGYLERARRAGLAQARLVADQLDASDVRVAGGGQGRRRADPGRPPPSADLPPALAAMMEERRADARDRAAEAAAGGDRVAAAVHLARDPGSRDHARPDRGAVRRRLRAPAGRGAAARPPPRRDERPVAVRAARGSWSTG